MFNLKVPFQVPVRVDGVKIEPGVSTMEEDLVERENVENMLEEERDGTCVCSIIKRSLLIRPSKYIFCVIVGGDEDESRRDREGDDGRRLMEMDLVEASVSTAAASALSSAASKAKVESALSFKADKLHTDV